MRVSSGDGDSWNQLEAALRHKYLPSLTGKQTFSDQERQLLSLPAKLGGIGVTDPSKASKSQHEASRKVSAPLMSSIHNSGSDNVQQVHLSQKELKAEVQNSNLQKIKSHATEIRASLPQNLQAAVEQSCESGASSGLTALPITEFGFNLYKQTLPYVCSMGGPQPPSVSLCLWCPFKH